MQLDDVETEEQQSQQQQQQLAHQAPHHQAGAGEAHLINFQEMNFQQLLAANHQGGDPRLYEHIRKLLSGQSGDDEDDGSAGEDLCKLYDEMLLKQLTSHSAGGDSVSPEAIGDHKKGEVNIEERVDGRLFYKGYPESDFIRQINVVLHTWNKTGYYPVNFVRMECFNDETDSCIQHLNSMTHLVFQLFEALAQSSVTALHRQLTRDLFMNMGPRGVLTMLGFRKTAGSQDVAWPTLFELKASFNQPHTVLSEEQKKKTKNPPSKLTVGARALTKHCHRSSEGFWGTFRGTETKKNDDANLKLDEVLRDCIWVNVHIIVHSETIVECRIEQGYGMRWTGDGRFRGFLEPQMDGGHERGWRH